MPTLSPTPPTYWPSWAFLPIHSGWRVPRAFISRIRRGDPLDPLLRQVMSDAAEFIETPGFSTDPLEEQHSVVPGLLHKYQNRALLLVKGGCAVNCRYCFRRHFPYQENQGTRANWQRAVAYLREHPELDEIIFSGGDPLMAKDHELDWLFTQLEQLQHLRHPQPPAGGDPGARDRCAVPAHGGLPSADGAGHPY